MYQNQTNNYEGLKTVTATFGLIVAGVVGYYFGQKPIESAQRRAQGAEEKSRWTTTTSKDGLDKSIKEINSEIESVTRIADTLETIKKTLGIT